MVELKVNVDGMQRVVCGVSDATKCQDVVLALAQATGQTGRFNLVEKCRDSERSLRPHEHPLRVMSMWGPNAKDAYFLMRRTGATPANSRPPSVTQEIGGDRFRQVSSPVGSVDGFPQQRQASVRRSQTFSGYRGGATLRQHQGSSGKDEPQHRELTEVVSVQHERITNQYRDLVDLEDLIRTLAQYETLEDPRDGPDSALEELELCSRRNRAELRELEFWESELDIESQLQSALEEKMAQLAGRLARCEEELASRQQEIDALTRRIEEQQERLRREEVEATDRRLAEIQEEIMLLEREHEGYAKSAQEMDATLADLDHGLEEKRSQELRLIEELARDNMKDFAQTPAVEPADAATTHSTHSMDRTSRQRTQSTPPEMYATFPFRRLVSARHLAVAEPTGDNPEGIFV